MRLVLLAAVLLLAAPAAQARPVTIAATGDFLIHQPVWSAAQALAGGSGYRFAPLLRPIRPLIRRADLALCHVETPLLAGAPSGFPRFRTPPALARAIRRTGYDACSTASNHTLDQGAAGVRGTVRALDARGVAHAGSATSPQRARRIPLLRARGTRVAFLAYTAVSNGQAEPHPYSLAEADPRRIRRDAARARRQGADVVVVNLHWGTEYRAAPDATQGRLARQVLRSRAVSAIVGQHVHVVQPVRRVRGRPVVYGTGNLLSNQTAACCPAASQDGMVVLLRLRGDRVRRVDYVPTTVRHPDMTVVRAARGSASWRRTVATVGRGARLRPRPPG